MRIAPALSLLLVLAAATLPSTASHAAAEEAPTVVVVVFDGVVPSVLDVAPTPALDRMRSEGAWSHHLEPPFPTISLIAGFTLSTGCWPEHHGIVTNKFLDPERGLYDHSRDADWMTGCEGLTEIAERQGVRSAALAWYGDHSETRGALASVVVDQTEWKGLGNDPTRAEWVATQLAREDADRPHLIAAYLAGPDGALHYTGMDSPETKQAVIDMDAAVGRVMQAIAASPRAASTTLFVTTDHGMLPVDTLVNIGRILHWHDIPARAISTGTTAFLYFEESDEQARAESVAEAVLALSQYDDAFEVLRRDALPAYARLGQGYRVPELIVSARPPHFIEDTELWPSWLHWLERWGPRFAPAGSFVKATHGYPPAMPEMHGILYAWGARVAPGHEVEHVRSIDLHPTVAHLLRIEPGRPVDGAVAHGFLEAVAR